MNRMSQKLISVFLALAMATSLLTVSAAAATNSFEKTDNISQNMINAALANIGKKNADFPNMPKDQWCAYFICWLAQVSGASDQGYLSGNYYSSGTTRSIAEYSINHQTGIFTSFWDTAYDYLVSLCGASNLIQKGSNNTYTPRAGDIVFFHWNGANVKFASHVGLVYNVTNSTIEYVDGNGTSGGYSNSYVTTHSLSRTSNEISGYLRLNTDGALNTVINANPSVRFSLPTQSEYVAKQQVTETNAVLVNQIVKPSGTTVTQMGIYLYDSNGVLLKKYSENVSNVPASQTLYHSWFDVNQELGITLSPGAAYQYALFGVFNGQEIKGDIFTFKTAGSASQIPVSSYFSLPTQSEYVAKQQVTETNAVLVNQINKPSGTTVTQMGIYLYDSAGNLLTRYSENVTNVSASQTLYHSWFDVNQELGITLKSGTTYQYAMFGLFNGAEQKGPVYSFTTKGSVPVQEPDPVEEPAPVEEPDPIQEPDPVKPVSITFAQLDAVDGAVQIDLDNAQIKIQVTKNAEVKLDQIGFSFYDGNGDEIISINSGANGGQAGETTVLLTYSFSESELAKLTAGQSYLYAGRVVVDGQTYRSPVWKCTVKKEEPKVYILKLQIASPYLYVNGEQRMIDASGTTPVVINDRTMMPVRAIIEAMGGTVGWDDNTQMVSNTIGSRTLYLQIDNTVAWDNTGNIIILDSEPKLMNDRTMLPIRAVAEYFGASVGWDDYTQTVTIIWTES